MAFGNQTLRPLGRFLIDKDPPSSMGNVKRLKGLQAYMFGDFKEPEFIPTNRDIQMARLRQFAAHKLLNGWDPKAVIEYLVMFNGIPEEKARKIVAPLYNRMTTPLKQLKKEYH